MSSDSSDEYSGENEEMQPDTFRESATVEQETGKHDNQQNKNANDEKKVVKPKRIIRNPQPRFNEQTIRTAKGLPALLGHFKDVKFKGKGFEEQDLNRLMKIYEYWSHRFYPMFTFDDSIKRFEYLGNKRSTQVYLSKVRMGEDVFEEHISEEEIETKGSVKPFNDQFNNLSMDNNKPEPELTEDQLERINQNRLRALAIRKERLNNLLSMDNNKSEPELTEDQLERINQNRLRAVAIRKERLSRINGETSQQYSLGQNNDTEAHNVQLEANEEELDIDNILKLVNEVSESPGCEARQDINKEQLYDEKISNAIRMNAISDSESDVDNDKVIELQKENSNQYSNNDNSNSSSSSNESVVSSSSQLKKKKTKSLKKINNSHISFRKKSKISTDSDEDLNKSIFTHKSQQNKSERDEDNVQQPSQSHFTHKNNLIETSDSDNEQPIQNINTSIEENLPNITHKPKEINQFLDSDQESDNFDGTGKFKQKGRLIIDTDESD